MASKRLSLSELQTRRTRVDDEEDVELKYKLGKELGRGAFGVVLEGTQLSSGKVFAVKVIPKERVSGWLACAPVRAFKLLPSWSLFAFVAARAKGDGACLACGRLWRVVCPFASAGCVQSRGVRCDVTLCHSIPCAMAAF